MTQFRLFVDGVCVVKEAKTLRISYKNTMALVCLYSISHLESFIHTQQQQQQLLRTNSIEWHAIEGTSTKNEGNSLEW